MAALLFRTKKGVNLSCTSPASSAGSSSTDYHQLSPDRQSSRELDRRTPLLRREHDLNWVADPLFSKNKTHLQMGRWSSGKPSDRIGPAASTRCLLGDDEVDALFDVFEEEPDLLPPLNSIDPARFRSAAGDDSAALKPSSSSFSSSSSCSSAAKERENQVLFGASSSSAILQPSTKSIQTEMADGSAVSLPSATSQAAKRDADAAAAAMLEGSRFDRPQEQAFFGASSSSAKTGLHATADGDSALLRPSPSAAAAARSQRQVVVLRVSLHCKGCEAKVRKHISRMEGVTSFSIDFDTKKVTVIGDVTPLGVLSSVSKVKSAQFWPSPPSSRS